MAEPSEGRGPSPQWGELALWSGLPRERGPGEYDPRADPSMQQLRCAVCGQLANAWINPELVPPEAGARAICASCSLAGQTLLRVPHPERCRRLIEVCPHCYGEHGGVHLARCAFCGAVDPRLAADGQVWCDYDCLGAGIDARNGVQGNLAANRRR